MQRRILHIVHIRLLGLIRVCPLWVESGRRRTARNGHSLSAAEKGGSLAGLASPLFFRRIATRVYLRE